jgi:hypothetical protein
MFICTITHCLPPAWLSPSCFLLLSPSEEHLLFGGPTVWKSCSVFLGSDSKCQDSQRACFSLDQILMGPCQLSSLRAHTFCSSSALSSMPGSLCPHGVLSLSTWVLTLHLGPLYPLTSATVAAYCAFLHLIVLCLTFFRKRKEDSNEQKEMG